LLTVKAHQLYQDIILLKAHLTDILPQYDTNTNLLLSQPYLTTGQASLPGPIDSHLDRSLNNPVLNHSPIQPNIDLIEKFIDSPVLSSYLKALATSLHQSKNFQFYTDGSLQRDPKFIDSMGIGWISAQHKELTFSTSAILWPSSTKAEMLAYLTTLMVAPVIASVTLVTDSAATIDDMANLQEMMHQSIRKREKIPNFPIWMTIAYTIEALDLKVTMIKIKAHSRDRLNEWADKLAKDATFSALQLNLHYTKLPDLNLVIVCNHLIIENSSRRCIKQLQDAGHFHNYLQLQRNTAIKTLTEL